MSLKVFEQQELVNPVELSKAIGIDAATVRKWITEGWLPAVDMRSPWHESATLADKRGGLRGVC